MGTSKNSLHLKLRCGFQRFLEDAGSLGRRQDSFSNTVINILV